MTNHTAITPPDADVIRQAIAAQMCPFCTRGPFAMLPVHTNKMHGVDKWELRDLAGFSTQDPLCSDEVRAAMRERSHPENLVAANDALKNGRSPQRWTRAGLAKNAAALAAWQANNPDEAIAAARANARMVTSEGRAKQKKAAKTWWASHPDQKRAFADRTHTPETEQKRAATRQANFREPEHGTTARYKRGCRCESCREAKSIYRQSHGG